MTAFLLGSMGLFNGIIYALLVVDVFRFFLCFFLVAVVFSLWITTVRATKR